MNLRTFRDRRDCSDEVPAVDIDMTGVQKSLATKFYTVAPNIFGSSVWNLLHGTLLVRMILSGLLFFNRHLWNPVMCYGNRIVGQNKIYMDRIYFSFWVVHCGLCSQPLYYGSRLLAAVRNRAYPAWSSSDRCLLLFCIYTYTYIYIYIYSMFIYTSCRVFYFLYF